MGPVECSAIAAQIFAKEFAELIGDPLVASRMRAGVNCFVSVLVYWRTGDKLSLTVCVNEFFHHNFVGGAAAGVQAFSDVVDFLYSSLPSRDSVETTAMGPNDFLSALLQGNYSDDMPHWLGEMLVLGGKLMGLSIAGASGLTFLPEWLLTFCKDSKITAGNLIVSVYSALEDLMARARDCVALRSIAPLFSAEMREQALIDAAVILGTDARALKVEAAEGLGGMAIASLRLEMLGKARGRL